eukprot:Opistho-1_new@107027
MPPLSSAADAGRPLAPRSLIGRVTELSNGVSERKAWGPQAGCDTYIMHEKTSKDHSDDSTPGGSARESGRGCDGDRRDSVAAGRERRRHSVTSGAGGVVVIEGLSTLNLSNAGVPRLTRRGSLASSGQRRASLSLNTSSASTDSGASQARMDQGAAQATTNAAAQGSTATARAPSMNRLNRATSASAIRGDALFRRMSDGVESSLRSYEERRAVMTTSAKGSEAPIVQNAMSRLDYNRQLSRLDKLSAAASAERDDAMQAMRENLARLESYRRPSVISLNTGVAEAQQSNAGPPPAALLRRRSSLGAGVGVIMAEPPSNGNNGVKYPTPAEMAVAEDVRESAVATDIADRFGSQAVLKKLRSTAVLALPELSNVESGS